MNLNFFSEYMMPMFTLLTVLHANSRRSLCLILWLLCRFSVCLPVSPFPLNMRHDDGDVHPRWPPHQNTRDLTSYFEQTSLTLFVF